MVVSSRVLGAREARAPVLPFLDAHCECSPGWLEPLMAQVAADRTVSPCPIIDIIDDVDFSYSSDPIAKTVGVFGWNFIFNW